MHLAFNEPKRLEIERARILASAAGKVRNLPAAEALARGERMARFIRKGRVLEN